MQVPDITPFPVAMSHNCQIKVMSFERLFCDLRSHDKLSHHVELTQDLLISFDQLITG
jgi:hypothetical protein